MGNQERGQHEDAHHTIVRSSWLKKAREAKRMLWPERGRLSGDVAFLEGGEGRRPARANAHFRHEERPNSHHCHCHHHYPSYQSQLHHPADSAPVRPELQRSATGCTWRGHTALSAWVGRLSRRIAPPPAAGAGSAMAPPLGSGIGVGDAAPPIGSGVGSSTSGASLASAGL